MQEVKKDSRAFTLTPGQVHILDQLATIQAELACLVRETHRTHQLIIKVPGANDSDR